MRGEIRALEGVCCAGKTTLIKQLAKQLGAAVVPELPEFGRNLFLPFNSPDNVRLNAFNSVNLEKIRMRAAYGLTEITPHIVMDRSFLSTLALGYGAIDLIGPPSFKELADRVLTAMMNDELPTPHKTLYISVDSETVQKRNETRSPKLDEYWVNPERIKRQNEFYRNLSHVTGIEIIDGGRPREEVLADCLEKSLDPLATISTWEAVATVQDFTNNIAYER